tara:strand:+ start:771 stop:899 length:129 start_codon:yes stop_codon:yes gene_type:complete
MSRKNKYKKIIETIAKNDEFRYGESKFKIENPFLKGDHRLKF